MSGTFAVVGALLCGLASPPSGPEFRFAVISDAHVPADGSRGIRAVVEAIRRLDPRPAFVVDTGDCTELGWADEVDAYVRTVREPLVAAGIPLYAVPGNHDARWSGTDTLYFQTRLNRVPALVRTHGIALALLNAALPGEQHGNLLRGDMAAMEREVEALDPHVPVLAFMHTPALPANPYLSGGVGVLDALGEAGVAALFVGHGHGWDRWRINGVEQLMTGAALGGAYRIVDVSRSLITTWGVGPDRAEVAGTRLTLPLQPRPRARIVLAQPRAVPGAERVTVDASVEGIPAPVSVAVRVDGGPAVTAEVGHGPQGVGISVEGLAAGIHTVTASAETGEAGSFIAEAELATSSPAARIEWVLDLGESVFASPALEGGRVYAAAMSGMVLCVDRETSREVWRFHAAGPVQSAPAVAAGRVAFGCGDGAVYALSSRTGRLLWRTPVGGPVRSSPTIALGRVYVGSGDGRMRCLDARDGSVRWEHAVGRLIESRPAVANGRVVFGAWNQKVHCLAATDGRELWTAPVGRNVYYSPATSACAIRDGRAFASAPNNTIYGFDLGTGAPLWEAEGSAGYTSPTFGPDGTLIYGSMDGSLIGLDPATGRDRFRNDVGPGTFNASPTVVGDTAVVGALNGDVLVGDARTGIRRLEVPLGDTLMFATPAFDGRWIVAGTMSGRLVGIRLAPGPP